MASPEDKSKRHRASSGPVLDGRATLGGIYGSSAIYPDTVDIAKRVGRMLVTPDKTDRRYQLTLDNQYYIDSTTAHTGITILPEHSEDHFPPGSGLPAILQGHKGLRLAAATLGAIADFNTLAPGEATAGRESYTRITGFERATFEKPIKVGNEVTIKADLTGQSQPDKQGQPTLFTGNASLFVGGELATLFQGLTVAKRDEPKVEPLLADQIFEFAAQSYVVELLALRSGYMPLLASIGRTRFEDMDVTPGRTLLAIAQRVRVEEQRYFVSSVVADEGGNKVAEIDEIQAAVRPAAVIKFALSR